MRALMYHRLGEGRYALQEDLFKQHCLFFSECSDQVMITIDDGHASAMRMAEILNSFDIKAIFFITTSLIGEKDFVNRNQVADLSRQGHQIGSHGHSHSFMTQLKKEKLKEEIQQSKNILEDITGQDILSLSFPGGRFNRFVLNQVQDIGFIKVWSSEPGHWHSSGALERCGRDCILAGTPVDSLRKLVSGHHNLKRNLRYFVLSSFKFFTGDAIYHKIASKE